MNEYVKVEGLKELDAALAQLPEALRRGTLLRALRKASAPVAEEARVRAPRGKNPLKRGSKKDRRSRRSATIGAGADSIKTRAERGTGPYNAAVSVGPDRRHFYLRFSELGTSRQPARPFMRPAFEITRYAAIIAFGEEAWPAIAKTAERLAKRAERGTWSKRDERALTS